jgi:nitrous oxidase accessory protein NosD
MSTGLHVRESSGTVEHCRFEENEVGLRFNSSRLDVRDNLFLGNGAGIRFHFGLPRIAGNVFRGNGTGVFVTDDPGTFTLAGNRFEGNRDYALKLGEPVDEDVPAPGNWWGPAGEAGVPAAVFDRADAEHLGRVLVDPVLAPPPPDPAVPD